MIEFYLIYFYSSSFRVIDLIKFDRYRLALTTEVLYLSQFVVVIVIDGGAVLIDICHCRRRRCFRTINSIYFFYNHN